MRLLALLTLIVCAASGCEEARAQDLGGETIGNGAISAGAIGNGAIRQTGAAASPFSEVFSALFADPTRSNLPVCTAATDCALQCYAEIDGDWVCFDELGASVAVTAGSAAPTAATLPWGAALLDINTTTAPRLTTPADWVNFWTTPHTVVWVGHTSARTSSVQYMLEHRNSNGFEMRNSSSNMQCIWSNTGAAPTGITVSAPVGPSAKGVAAYGCIKSGTGASSAYSAWTPTTMTAGAAWPNDPATSNGVNFYFGRSNSGGSPLPMRGALVSVTIYNAAKTAAQMEEIQAQISGIDPDVADTFDFIGNDVAYMPDDDGQYWPTSLARIDDDGLWIEEHNDNSNGGGLGSNWAADATDASSWTDVGTPTVTTAQAAGPFSRWLAANDGDLIVDDDAAAFEGKQASNTCGTTGVGRFTVSCFLRQGTSGTVTDRARLVVTTDGTGSTTCDHTITGSFARYTCTTTIGGTPSATRGQVLVGDSVDDTGSILVAQCQCDRRGFVMSPKPNATYVGLDKFSFTTAETAGFPNGQTDGEIEVAYSLEWTAPTDVYDNGESFFFHDLTLTGGNDHSVIHWYQQADAALKMRTTDGVDFQNTQASVSFAATAGVDYVSKARWVGTGAPYVNHYMFDDACADLASCEASTQVGSSTDGTRIEPPSPYGPLKLGRRYNDLFGMNGHIGRITVRSR